MSKDNLTTEYQGTNYFDDRLFVLYVCASKVEIQNGIESVVLTTIYHENPPQDHIWSVVTYRNCERYPLYRVDSFHNKEDAIAYRKKVEPETPLISLDGRSPYNPLPYEEYIEWKKVNGFKDYDWKPLYISGGENARETIYQTKESFIGIK